MVDLDCLEKKCEKCGGEMKVIKQIFRLDPEPGDEIVLKCELCGCVISEFIPYPEDYALFFKEMKRIIDGLS